MYFCLIKERMQILDFPDTAVKVTQKKKKKWKYSACREGTNKRYIELNKVIMPKSTYSPALDACFKNQKKQKTGGKLQTNLANYSKRNWKKNPPQNNTKTKQIKKSQNQTKTKQKRSHPKTQKTTISNATEIDYFRPLRI